LAPKGVPLAGAKRKGRRTSGRDINFHGMTPRRPTKKRTFAAVAADGAFVPFRPSQFHRCRNAMEITFEATKGKSVKKRKKKKQEDADF